MRSTLILVLIFTALSAAAQSAGWNITATNGKNYSGIVLANGRLGILPSSKPFTTEKVILNNVYDKENPLGVSKIVAGMNFGNLVIEIDGEKLTENNITNWKQTLNLKEAGLTTSFIYKEKATVSYTVYALRNMPFSGYFNFTVQAKEPININVTGKIEIPDEYQHPTATFRTYQDGETKLPILLSVAKSRQGRHTVSTAASFVFIDDIAVKIGSHPELKHSKTSEFDNGLTFEKKIAKNATFNFAWTAAECTSQDFFDPQSESERLVISNLLTPVAELIGKHKKLWEQLWEGDIVIDGDLKSQQDVRLALYHLYSFGRGDNNLSIAPMGLSSQGYNGHIFWDAEIWMFPPLLVLNHEIATSMVNYRSDRLEVAKRRATNVGYQGAMFPWESDDSGEESTPIWALTGPFEQHITADVAIAFWNYYRVTKDKQWLSDNGYKLIKEVADFWISRVSKNQDGSYSIKNVVGANEFLSNIDDNTFTNGSAITALRYSVLAAKELGLAPNPQWTIVAENMKMHKFPDGTTRENSTYNGAVIKQADANLLAYPLDIVNTREAVLKDLKYYEPRIAKDGPAMGKSIFAVIYARLGDADNAYRLFKESYEPNRRSPFGALSETATGNNPYFATGAGGLLQVVLFGFGGLHFTENGIIQKNPILPKEWKSLTIKGVGVEKKTYTIKQ